MTVSFVPRTRYYIIQLLAEKVTKKLKVNDTFVKNVRRDTNIQKTASVKKR